MKKHDLLIMSPYTDQEMANLETEYRLYRFYESVNQFEMLKELAYDIQAIATRGDVGVPVDVMAALPGLKMIASYGVGTDAINLDYAKCRGISVTNTPDILTDDVADMAVALLMAAARRIPQGDSYVRNGNWLKANMNLVTRVHGKKVGIVGMGRIGTAVAKRLSAFDCQIHYFSTADRQALPYIFVANLLDLADQCEFLIVTLAGGKETQGIIDANILQALGRNGILINVSRGSVIDETALIAALESGTLKGAGLDVFWTEPNIDSRFMKLKNVVLQPHHASATLETRCEMSRLMRDNLRAFFQGKALPTPVN